MVIEIFSYSLSLHLHLHHLLFVPLDGSFEHIWWEFCERVKLLWSEYEYVLNMIGTMLWMGFDCYLVGIEVRLPSVLL